MSLNVFYSNVWNRQPLPKSPFSTFSSQHTPWCSFLNSKLTSLCPEATGSHRATVCAYPVTFPEHTQCGPYFWCLWLNEFRALPTLSTCPQIPLACWTELHVVDISYFLVKHPEKWSCGFPVLRSGRSGWPSNLCVFHISWVENKVWRAWVVRSAWL